MTRCMFIKTTWEYFSPFESWGRFLKIRGKFIVKKQELVLIWTSCCTVPSATWQIFFQFLIFFNLVHELLGDWNNSKNMRNEGKICHIARDNRVITSLSLEQKEWHSIKQSLGNQAIKCFWQLGNRFANITDNW